MTEAIETEKSSLVSGGGSRVIGLPSSQQGIAEHQPAGARLRRAAAGAARRRLCGDRRQQAPRGGAYTRRYDGFTLLIRSGDKYFVTPTPTDKQTAWDPVDDAVFIIPDDNEVRMQLTRGAAMPPPSSRPRRARSASLVEWPRGDSFHLTRPSRTAR